MMNQRNQNRAEQCPNLQNQTERHIDKQQTAQDWFKRHIKRKKYKKIAAVVLCMLLVFVSLNGTVWQAETAIASGTDANSSNASDNVSADTEDTSGSSAVSDSNASLNNKTAGTNGALDNDADSDTNSVSDKDITILFTHDSHDYLYPTTTIKDGETKEHGGAAKLKTLVDQNMSDTTYYLDCGDFSMGTLYQAAYSTDAYELRNLGHAGCMVTTFGNHEFDYGLSGITAMLKAAMASGDELPAIVQSNIDFSGELTEEQQEFKDTLEKYGAKEYLIEEMGGYTVGIFGLMGYDCIECTQADLSYVDYIEQAKTTVEKIKAEGVDLIICLSHSGTNGDGETGEDIDLAKEVPDIDLIISGHSHSTYEEPIYIGNTVVVSCGEYLENLGKISFSKQDDVLTVSDYDLIPLDDSVEEDEETKALFEEYKKNIEKEYLSEYDLKFDQVICHSDFDLIDLGTMYATHQEYTMGNVIADSYIYEAEQNGIDDIDVALVGLGTIRGSIKYGNITVADAFEICSLGVGSDGSAGHPIASAYITGKELKLLTELDASLGTLVSSIKMSYSGLEYTANTKRIILDRVTDVHLVREDGTTEEIVDDQLYRVCANMYAVNMLGMLNGLTKGILSITPKYADGTPVEDFYDVALVGKDGKEIKEWVAFADYLSSFDKNEDGISELPSYYARPLGRKVIAEFEDESVISNPGTATKIMPTVIGIAAGIIAVLIALTVFLIVRHRRKKKHNLFH